ncbi:hypothetical protein BDP27DRAFT_1459185 [Rhodocollybia butyracea]|uniref:Cupin type-2 domain-containing protein n=1 Tax=Rhodocollybia butyracea TaxID=206335 RepID=A0A9P5QBN3_9AGAR|nr:hypothetical protein BDP27DRAFT_1459185 [Rhodocollybia butyracea]
MSDYPDTLTIFKGITMVRITMENIGRTDDDLLHVPSHWHENHDELIHVLEGQLEVKLGLVTKICTPETGEVFIPRGVPHSLLSLKGIPCKYDAKELFFRNIFALPAESLLPVMQVFYHGDIFPVFPVIHSAWLEKAFVTILGGYIAPCLGYRVKYVSLKKS